MPSGKDPALGYPSPRAAARARRHLLAAGVRSVARTNLGQEPGRNLAKKDGCSPVALSSLGVPEIMTSRRSREFLSLLTILTLVTVLASAAGAYPRPGSTKRVSTAPDGTEGDSRSVWPSISADGRFASFESLARNLVPGDTNETTDIFVHDRQTGALERVSLTSTGSQANGPSSGPAGLSEDGRFIVFQSAAANLVPGDTNKVGDVYVRDLATGELERVSVSSEGVQSTGYSWGISISGDGRRVAFESVGSNLVEGDTNRHWDAFVRDRDSNTTRRVSIASDGTEGNSVSQFPTLSADGRFVAFESRSTNLVPRDTNGATDIFVHNLTTGETERVSVASDGSEANSDSTSFARRGISLSADGRFVAYHSYASNLVPNDTNESRDVFVHDRETGITERVSISSSGEEGVGYAGFPWLSADGRLVGFHSSASLVPGDDNGDEDVYLHDRLTGTTEMISGGHDGRPSDMYTRFASLSADGSSVAFHTAASNIVPGDTNGQLDIFVRERGPALGISDLSVQTQDGTLALGGQAYFSGAIISSASDAPGDGAPAAVAAGAEITGARLIHRVEEEDLLATIDLASFPTSTVGGCVSTQGFGCYGVSGGAGAPGILHGVTFSSGDVRFEVRSARVGVGIPPSVPYFALFRCNPSCSEVDRLAGGIATAGTDVRVSIPLELLEGANLTGIEAFSALGDVSQGEMSRLDEVSLPDAVIEPGSIELGIAPAGTDAEAVGFDTRAELLGGSFSGTLAQPDGAGEYDVWARACLAGSCKGGWRTITIGGGQEVSATSLTLTVTGTGVNRMLQATLIDDGPAAGIPGRTIEFLADGEAIGTAVTDADGVATLSAPPRFRGGKHIFEAIFRGDAAYLGSSAEAAS